MKVNSPEDADLILQKVPSDIGMHRIDRKATLDAPHKILDDFDFNVNVLVAEVFPYEFDLEETHERIGRNTEEFLGYELPLLSIGGDHSISYRIIRKLKEENPDMEVVWLDAHLDLKEKVDNHVSHDVVMRELLDIFEEDEVHFLGVTRIDEDEEKFIENRELEIADPEDALETASNIEESVYLSVDIDVLKQSQAPGTGYPDGEMNVDQVMSVIESLDIMHADLVEVAPPLDSGETLENARNLLSQLERALTS